MAAPKPREEPAMARRQVSCRTCGQKIDVPEGWSHGPAVRRHYWSEHRDVMLAARSKKEAPDGGERDGAPPGSEG
ncbi:MAG: hypothetical protein M3273_08550 [Actinomycetota bacterium]|nr:hypothetical protein [Actinomycetota bacterium]